MQNMLDEKLERELAAEIVAHRPINEL